MSSFADRMQSFTSHLTTSIREREDALARVHRATDDLLDGARTFMEGVAGDHRAMAEELRAEMDAFRTDLDATVREMRHRHQEAHQQRSGDLHRMLGDTRRAREENVRGLKDAFHTAQRELNDDLRRAGQAWREFAAKR